jgi:hypothetical protein
VTANNVLVLKFVTLESNATEFQRYEGGYDDGKQYQTGSFTTKKEKISWMRSAILLFELNHYTA